mmetsp:Transcript_43677/g.50234  ORF Transcript_43677/g.50234 Transcript_43677/m.50234 type:complete len:425 (+) Transcript_43677:76-1350(+)|eukprot:CAMPEP_0114994092 /NCGR_PEP_ID=MMETSP0216-20121206/12918_1 /TAXON_ID=223996 /ORGANISM="Protocruzia adherens, Strain Boccale" /LENGTH=424 /DNA_ID=CAMNT_0002357857 /DNA_START=23 /DNA_END=1300 /DNA_ORIENTATION=-
MVKSIFVLLLASCLVVGLAANDNVDTNKMLRGTTPFQQTSSFLSSASWLAKITNTAGNSSLYGLKQLNGKLFTIEQFSLDLETGFLGSFSLQVNSAASNTSDSWLWSLPSGSFSDGTLYRVSRENGKILQALTAIPRELAYPLEPMAIGQDRVVLSGNYIVAAFPTQFSETAVAEVWNFGLNLNIMYYIVYSLSQSYGLMFQTFNGPAYWGEFASFATLPKMYEFPSVLDPSAVVVWNDVPYFLTVHEEDRGVRIAKLNREQNPSFDIVSFQGNYSEGYYPQMVVCNEQLLYIDGVHVLSFDPNLNQNWTKVHKFTAKRLDVSLVSFQCMNDSAYVVFQVNSDFNLLKFEVTAWGILGDESDSFRLTPVGLLPISHSSVQQEGQLVDYFSKDADSYTTALTVEDGSGVFQWKPSDSALQEILSS